MSIILCDWCLLVLLAIRLCGRLCLIRQLLRLRHPVAILVCGLHNVKVHRHLHVLRRDLLLVLLRLLRSLLVWNEWELHSASSSILLLLLCTSIVLRTTRNSATSFVFFSRGSDTSALDLVASGLSCRLEV